MLGVISSPVAPVHVREFLAAASLTETSSASSVRTSTCPSGVDAPPRPPALSDAQRYGQACEPAVPSKTIGLLDALLRRGGAEHLASEYAFLLERRAASAKGASSGSEEEDNNVFGKPKNTNHVSPHRDDVNTDAWLGVSRGLQWGGSGASTRWLLERGGLLSLVTVEWKASRLAEAKAALNAPGGAALRARWTPVLAPPMGEIRTLERLEGSDENHGPLAPFVRAGVQAFEDSASLATASGAGDDQSDENGSEGGAETEAAGRAGGERTSREEEGDESKSRDVARRRAQTGVEPDASASPARLASPARALLRATSAAATDDASVLPPPSIDFAIVGGGARPACLRAAAARLPTSGGVLVLENSNRKAYQEAIDTLPAWWPRYDAGDARQAATVWITCTEQECGGINKKIPV